MGTLWMHAAFMALRIGIPLIVGAAAGVTAYRLVARLGRAPTETLAARLAGHLAMPLGIVVFLGTAWTGLAALVAAHSHALHAVAFLLVVAALTLMADRLVGEATEWHLHSLAARTGTVELHSTLVPLARQLFRGLLFFLGGVVVLGGLGVNVTAFVTTAGVASLAFALAAQDTLANIFSGIAILFDRPFRVGDRIETAGVIGDVVGIGLRSTRIRTFANNLVVIPNKEIAANQVTNRAYPDIIVTLQVDVGVGYGTDMAVAKQRMLEVAQACPHVLQDPAPAVYFTGFGDSALNLQMWVYVHDYRRQFATLDALNTGILDAFRAAGIEIPFPQRVVTMLPSA